MSFFIIICIIILIVILFGFRFFEYPQKSTFVSQRAIDISKQSLAAFSKSKSYNNFKHYVKDHDPVIYTDAHKLYRSGNLTPEKIQEIL